MRISDWSSDVCSSDLGAKARQEHAAPLGISKPANRKDVRNMVSRAEVNHTFSDAELDELRGFGEIESHRAGDLLVEEGAMAPDCIVTLSGHTDIFASTDEGHKRVGRSEERRVGKGCVSKGRTRWSPYN